MILTEIKRKKGGLYIHVPFCPQVCNYCDFAVMKAPERLHLKWLNGVKREVELKKKEWVNHSFKTIYLGGGTPSILSSSILEELLVFIRQAFSSETILEELIEVNLEVNPEHVNAKNIEMWLSIGFNRFSIGIQSFDDEVLKTLGRSHSSALAESALNLLNEYKLNFSADLMFGLPNQTIELFKNDLEKLCSFEPSHLSFYGLTIEEGTLFSQWEAKNKVEFPEDYDVSSGILQKSRKNKTSEIAAIISIILKRKPHVAI